MRDFLQIVKMNKWFLLYIFHSIYFNFLYLPWTQAIRLPILLYRPRFLLLKGSIQIVGEIKTGMILIGFYRVPLYPDKGCLFEIKGNVTFEGKAKIGNDSKICVGENASVVFGRNFNSTASLKLVCYHKVTIGENVLIGWDNLILDYDFHKITYKEINGRKSDGFAPVVIGHDSWLTNRVSVYKGVTIPPYTIVAAGTILTRSFFHKKDYCLIGSEQKVIVLKEGVWRNYLDDKFEL